jgi:hypothetical protein
MAMVRLKSIDVDYPSLTALATLSSTSMVHGSGKIPPFFYADNPAPDGLRFDVSILIVVSYNM